MTVYTISSPVYCCLAPTSSFEESSDDRFLASGRVYFARYTFLDVSAMFQINRANVVVESRILGLDIYNAFLFLQTVLYVFIYLFFRIKTKNNLI